MTRDDMTPTAAQVQAHAAAYPLTDWNGANYGGLWVTQDPVSSIGRNWPSFLRLCVVDGRVHLWNGFSFSQPLDECSWAARSTYRPVDQNGYPVRSDP